MAAGAWKFYYSFRERLGNGGINLSSGIYRITLHTSGTNAATATLSTKGSVTGEIVSGNGYSTSGKTLSSTTWASVAAGTYRFDACDWWVSANGGTIPPSGSDIKIAVLWESAGVLVAYATLSTTAFNVTATNRLTIQLNASGVFEMN